MVVGGYETVWMEMRRRTGLITELRNRSVTQYIGASVRKRRAMPMMTRKAGERRGDVRGHDDDAEGQSSMERAVQQEK